MKIKKDCGKSGKFLTCSMLLIPNFATLLNILCTVTILFKGKVVFKQHIQTHTKCSSNKNLQTLRHDQPHDTAVFLGKDRQYATPDMTMIHTAVKKLKRRVNGHGQKRH